MHMKILIIKEQRAKGNNGIEGSGIYLLNLCIEFNKKKIDYLVFYNAEDSLFKKMKQHSINVKLVDIPSGSPLNFFRRSRLKKIRELISNTIYKERITHINVHFPHLLNYLPKNIDIPIYAFWHGAFIDNKPANFFDTTNLVNLKKQIRHIYLNKYVFNFERANFVICGGEAASRTAKLKYLVPSKKILINKYGINKINPTKYSDIKNFLGFKESDKLILSVAKETKPKGVEDFCKLAKKLSHRDNYKFVFVGGYEDANYSLNLRAKYKDYVRFVGSVDNVFDFYKSADIFVFLSHRESAGLVLAEAMFFGLPLITWDVIGVNEMFTHNKEGLMFKFGDLEKLSDSIDGLLINQKEYDFFSSNSLNNSQKYLIDESAKNLINLLNKSNY